MRTTLATIILVARIIFIKECPMTFVILVVIVFIILAATTLNYYTE